jgi:transposase
MVWGAFQGTKKLKLRVTSNHVDSNEYQEILREHLLPFLRRNRRQKLIFQQDNASIHKSRSTMEWFEQNNIGLLQWASRSPDLNPIENVWGIMARRLYAGGKQYKDKNELRDAIFQVYEGLEPEILENLVNSMPNRIADVLEKLGGVTKY